MVTSRAPRIGEGNDENLGTKVRDLETKSNGVLRLLENKDPKEISAAERAGLIECWKLSQTVYSALQQALKGIRRGGHGKDLEVESRASSGPDWKRQSYSGVILSDFVSPPIVSPQENSGEEARLDMFIQLDQTVLQIRKRIRALGASLKIDFL